MHVKAHKELRSRMLKLDYTSAEVAAKIGISAQSMSDKMNCRSYFKSSEMAAIGNILKLSPNEYYTLFIKPIESYKKINHPN